ncbi:hypothetical protein HKBW3S09_00560 [Candidatus Hakubella thermalkaliphila]|uniref:Uncharacterized protein n=1 Tax=Candidatus Hakubella thermalkaliphila TaxID=2754717 RepID=A0A6V8NSU4_9ACTN|nr:hypothetical protein HKBW3S09_00560 [Candidatus Hakubella thermalkaliphila]
MWVAISWLDNDKPIAGSKKIGSLGSEIYGT